MPDFRMRGSVPIAEIINAQQRKAQMEQDAKNQELKNMLDMLNSGAQLGQIANQAINQTRQVGLAKDELAMKQRQQAAEEAAAAAQADLFTRSEAGKPLVDELNLGQPIGEGPLPNQEIKRQLASEMIGKSFYKSPEFMKAALPQDIVYFDEKQRPQGTYRSGFFSKAQPVRGPSKDSGGTKELDPDKKLTVYADAIARQEAQIRGYTKDLPTEMQEKVDEWLAGVPFVENLASLEPKQRLAAERIKSLLDNIKRLQAGSDRVSKQLGIPVASPAPAPTSIDSQLSPDSQKYLNKW